MVLAEYEMGSEGKTFSRSEIGLPPLGFRNS